MPEATNQPGLAGRGIVGYRAYLPAYRLNRADIAARARVRARAARAAWPATTRTPRPWEWRQPCRSWAGREPTVGSVWLRHHRPGVRRQDNATAVHAALELPLGIVAADLGASVRSGVVALLAAARGGGLAVLADRRGGPVGGADERRRRRTPRPPSCSAGGAALRSSSPAPRRSRPSSSTGGARRAHRTARSGRNGSASSATPSSRTSCWAGCAEAGGRPRRGLPVRGRRDATPGRCAPSGHRAEGDRGGARRGRPAPPSSATPAPHRPGCPGRPARRGQGPVRRCC